MSFSRREFIRFGFRSVVLIGTSGLWQSFRADSFPLPSKEKVRLRFAVVSDGHYGQPETDYAAFHDQMVRWLNAEKKARGLDFSFVNGDIIHDDPNMVLPVKQKWDGLSMPYYVSHGNHDMVPEKEWEKTFGRPWHYSFVQNEIPFLVLNTADATGTYICPDLDWANSSLQQFKSSEPLFVFMHITPLKWTKGSIDCTELVRLFDQQPNLKAVFHGHDHDQDALKQHNEKAYFFDGHLGGNWGTDYRGYRIVEVLNSGEILSYQVNAEDEKTVNTNTIR